MTDRLASIAEKLAEEHSLSSGEYGELIHHSGDPELAEALRRSAVEVRKKIYGDDVFIRGLIEVSNICRNDCLYCGIRRSNRHCDRYRLTPEQILACASEGYALGFRTFVLQGGEDPFFTDEVLTALIGAIKKACPGSAVTLSLGERSPESYRTLFRAGADRYLLRHETADEGHYKSLHPSEMSFQHRMECLRVLRETGFQTGCGFMVGSPGQTEEHLVKDLKFIEAFRPDMCGIGPFIPHRDTPFRDEAPGSVELTCFLLSLIRLIHPPVLLPATTALGTIHPHGREMGIQSGANVVMPNLSPQDARSRYELYNNKLNSGSESAQCLELLSGRMQVIGYRIVSARGDVKR